MDYLILITMLLAKILFAFLFVGFSMVYHIFYEKLSKPIFKDYSIKYRDIYFFIVAYLGCVIFDLLF